jgi:hypothetical protein
MPDKSAVLLGAAFTLGDKSYPTTMMYPHHIMVVGMEVACHTQVAWLSPRGMLQLGSIFKQIKLAYLAYAPLCLSKSIHG